MALISGFLRWVALLGLRLHAPVGGRDCEAGCTMQRTMFRPKIHRATVTHADPHHVGSVTIDADLLDAAGILPSERVSIVDVTTGSRLETYVIEGERGTGVIGVGLTAPPFAAPPFAA